MAHKVAQITADSVPQQRPQRVSGEARRGRQGGDARGGDCLEPSEQRECPAFSGSVVILGLNAALQKRFVLPPDVAKKLDPKNDPIQPSFTPCAFGNSQFPMSIENGVKNQLERHTKYACRFGSDILNAD